MNALQGARRLALPTGRCLRSASTAAKLNLAEELDARPFSELPRPKTLQFMRGFMPGGEFHDASMMEFALEMRNRYGDIFIMPGLFGRKDMVITFSTKDIEMVFRNEGIWPHREGFDSLVYFRTHVRPDVYSDTKGLIATQSEEWAKIRSQMNPIFMQPKGLKMYIEPLSKINNEFIERIKEIRDPHSLEVPANFSEEMSRVVFESIALIAFNREMGIIRRQRDNADALTLFKTSRDIFRYIFQLDMQPSLWKLWPTPTYKKMMGSLQDSMDAAQRIIDESWQLLEQRRQAGEDLTNNWSMFERMMKIDPKVALIMGLDILFAGVDASATTLSGLLLCMAKNPEKQAKLREELMRVLPTKDTLLTEQRLKELPYLRAVIKETLRYYPNGLGTFRQCAQDVQLSGYHIPQGTQILTASNALMKDNAYYPEADKFLPERWLRQPETGKKIQVNPFTFLPFGFGPRMCIGKRIVDLELETTLATLMRNFEVEFNYDASKPFKSFFVMEPNIPFQFKFTDVAK